MGDEPAPQKSHRERQAGRKFDKKKARNKPQDENMTARQRNPKAFAIQSVNKMARKVRRTLDIKEKKHHIPVVDRTPLEPPPVVVAVVGPPKVGKTTLIRCLVKNFTHQNLGTINGPITIVSGKKRRLTLLECNNDINSMIDIAKIADLVLLLVDASFGFEMETFEFLNIAQVHGFPRIMGVLTHLDMMKDNKALKKTKKRLKHRFWTEVYQGAKLFYLSGMVHGDYQKREVQNLGRFISVMKFRPLVWRNMHSYVLADRMEDLTNPELIRQNSKCDRTVSLYGYVRGVPLKQNSSIHIPGCGDFAIRDVSFLSDPCPLPDKEKKRSLNEKERLIYAPMSGVGGIVYDKDVVYVELGSHKAHSQTLQEEEGPTKELVTNLIGSQKTLDTKMAASKLTLFTHSNPVTSEDVDVDLSLGDQDNGNARPRRRAVHLEDMDDDEDDDDDSDDNEEEEEGDDDEWNIADDNDDNEWPVSRLSKQKADSKKRMKLDEGTVAFADSEDELEYDMKSAGGKDKTEDEKMRERKHSSTVQQNVDATRTVKCDIDVLKKRRGDLTSSKGSPDVTGRELQDSDEEEDDEEEDSEQEIEEDDEEEEDDDDDYEDDEGEREEEEEEADEDSQSGQLKWKENLRERAAESFLRQQTQTPNLRKLVYGTVVEAGSSDEEDSKELGGLFTLTKTKESKKKLRKGMNDVDCSSFPVEVVRDWTLDEMKSLIADCMVTGKWAEEEDAKTLLDQDDDLYGDFEDLETGEVHKGESSKSHHDDSDDDEEEEEEEEEDGGDEEKKKSRREMTMAEMRAEKKRKMKEMFDADYDNKGGESYFDELKEEMNQQAQLNRSEFADMEDDIRTQYEGFRSGMYVRVEIADVPCEFVTHFDPVYPIILGGLLNNEEAVGYVQMRLKKHRWYPKILKTRDPIILSVGWRRFQTIPLYSIQDHNGRNRLLKYTPEHMHCQSIIWGPITRQGTGVLAVQSVAGRQPGFRIAATGVILDLDKSVNIVKKLKLTGTPMKIHKNTAFIQGMFNTALEVVKFEGASIRTVSGIRGQIKKPLKSPPGAFRATFEDKILRSDIVFVSTWFQVAIPKLYNPVTTLLLAPEDKGNWTGMRTVGQLRHDANIPVPNNSDSQYKKVERKPRRFNPLVVPRSLQKELPFKEKSRSVGKKKRGKKGATLGALRAVIREPQERKVAALMHELSTLYKERERKERRAMATRVESHKKKMAVVEAQREQRQKKAKQEVYRLLGQMKKKNQR